MNTEKSKSFGNQRIEFVNAANSGTKKWEEWAQPKNPWSHKWGSCWAHQTIYNVNDFPSEAGFFIDILGMDCGVLSAEYGYALINSEDGHFHLGLRPADKEHPAIIAGIISLDFMIEDLEVVTEKIESNGGVFKKKNYQLDGLMVSDIISPAGILIRLWNSPVEAKDQ